MPIRERGKSAEERLERILELQTLLARVAREIGPALELQGVLSTVLESMRSLVDFRGGTIQLVDERGVYIAAADPPASDDVLASRVPVGHGSQRPGDLDGPDDLLARPPERRRGSTARKPRKGSNAATRSYLAVPLVVLGTTIGVLQIDSNDVDAFDEDDVAVLEGLAVQVAGSIESARRREDMIEVERMKADFIARISHELRTPLTVIGGFTDTLLLHGPTASDRSSSTRCSAGSRRRSGGCRR